MLLPRFSSFNSFKNGLDLSKVQLLHNNVKH